LSAGSARCWGYNYYGQLGSNDTDHRDTPSPVLLFRTLTQISAGGDHTCARDNAGKAWCWGRNSVGQIGNGTTAVMQLLPAEALAVSGTITVTSVSAGRNHSCARLSN